MRFARTLASLALAAATVVASACGDAAPTGTAAPSLSTYDLSSIFTSSTSGTSSSSSTTIYSSGGTLSTVSFTIYPGTHATIAINEHRIAFEPNAICDPMLSSYGPAFWDEPCRLATGGVRITAKSWRDASGKPVVDFQPALRFNPASRVTLYMLDEASASDPSYKILWASPTGVLLDESLLDPSLATMTGTNGYKYRRIKHFSGYLISTGRSSSSGGEAGDNLRGGVPPIDLLVPQPVNSGHVLATGAPSATPPRD